MERDVVLDKYGLLLTEKRRKRAEESLKDHKRKLKKEAEMRGLPQSSVHLKLESTSTRTKTTNVYRPYSTFHPVLPRNPAYWTNRDLRVMAPEGMGYWSSMDDQGRKTSEFIYRHRLV